MNNIIITADIHIYDYPQYNFTKDFRLNQFIKLAYRFIDIGKENNSKIICLLGDTIHKPIISPKVAHVASEFFEILSSYYSTIYYILGQHCTDSKSKNFLENDSIVPILGKHTNAIYAHKKIISICNRNIALCNWELKPDWSFINNKNIDVFLGHLTLDNKYGQEYDNSQYKIGFFGDIHKKLSIGKDHTVNVPIPHYISDEQNGSVICLNLDDLSWKRIDTECKSFQYLKMYYEENLPTKYNKDLTVIIKKPKIIDNVRKIYKSLDIDNLIKKYVKENNLLDVHNEILKNVPIDDVNIDFNFKLLNIEIKNFRSIKFLNYKFIDYGVTLITGENGSGKSSLMKAIEFVFCPPKSVKNLIKNNCKDMYVKLSLNYDNVIYYITRGVENNSSFLNIKIEYGGTIEELKSNSYSGMNNILVDKLPFIKMFDLFYRTQESNHILTDYNYSDRISLISNILNINIIEELHNQAKNKLSSIIKDIKKVTAEKELLESILSSLYDNRYSMDLINKLDTLIERNNLIDEKIKYLDDFLNKMNNVDIMKKEIDTLKVNLKLINMDNIESDNKGILLKKLKKLSSKKDKIILDRDKLDNIKNNNISEINKINLKIDSNEHNLKELNEKINSIKDFCPTCNQKLPIKDIKSLRNNFKKDVDIITRENEKLEKIRNDLLKDKIQIDNEENNFKNILLEIMNEHELINKDLQVIILNEENIKKYNNLIKIISKKEEELNIYIINNKLSNLSKEEINKDINKYRELYNNNNMDIFQIKNIISNKKKYDEVNDKFEKIGIDLDLLTDKKINYESYVKLFSNTGLIIQSIFQEISKIMSTENIMVSTLKKLSSGETRIDFNINYKVGRYLIPYNELSGGQKTLIDIYFLCKLYEISGKVGLLMLDETLSDLDNNNLEFIMDSLNNVDINNILITLHSDTFNLFNSRILVKLNNNDSEYFID